MAIYRKRTNDNPRRDPQAPNAVGFVGIDPASKSAGQFVRDRVAVRALKAPPTTKVRINGEELTVEKGARLRLTSNFPASICPVDVLASRLGVVAGGCTIQPGARGYWHDRDTGLTHEEAVNVVTVTHHDRYVILSCRSLLVELARNAGERWLDCQLDTFQAMHVETNTA